MEAQEWWLGALHYIQGQKVAFIGNMHVFL